MAVCTTAKGTFAAVMHSYSLLSSVSFVAIFAVLFVWNLSKSSAFLIISAPSFRQNSAVQYTEYGLRQMEVSQISHRAAGNSQYYFPLVFWPVLCTSINTALCHPSESTMSMKAGIEPRTVALSVAAAKHNRLHPYNCKLHLILGHHRYRIAELSTLTHIKYVIVDLLIYVFKGTQDWAFFGFDF
jgi:hypothetical protein